MPLNFQRTRDLLSNFQFSDLFIEELGWAKPSRQKAITLKIENKTYQYQRIAELSGVAIFEVSATDGKIPEAKVRAAIHQEITKLIAENLLIFIAQERTRSLWYWVKREGSKSYVRDHLYVKGQPGDLYKKHAFLPKALPDTDTPQDTRLIHLRKNIEQLNNKSQEKLNLLLLDEFSKRLGIKYEEVQLTGKSQKRVLKVEDIAALKPFHWGYHFDKVLEGGGFDAIITNPPWEAFKPNAKESFDEC